MFDWFKRKLTLEGLHVTSSRDELIRRSRVLVVDDERPELVDDLERAHFSVDYLIDITNAELDRVEQPLYDLVLLDFGSVGASFGNDQGLSLLRHIKRVNPSLVVLAYTSKALTSDQADFYRLADGVLAKDAGIGESTERIEEGLRKARSPENLWRGVLAASNIAPGSKVDLEWQDLLVRGVSDQRKLRTLRERVVATLGSEPGTKLALGLVEKILEAAVKAAIVG